MMDTIDVSTVVTLHREGKYLGRTLRSLSEAAEFAGLQGVRTELVAVLDRSDDTTRSVLKSADLSAFKAMQVLEVDHGSVSLSRNAGCDAAAGTWLDLIDGDDLTSFTATACMFDAAQRHGPLSVLVPKFSFAFGAKYFSVEYFSQHQIPSSSIVTRGLYTAKVFYHRDLHRAVTYQDVPLGKGYAYEDWHFHCNAMAAGYDFVAVDGVALLYRQRIDSRNHTADRISARVIPPSNLFRPEVFKSVFAADMRRHGDRQMPPKPRGAEVFVDQEYRAILARANAIDPAVDIGHFTWDCIGHFSNAIEPHAGVAYYHLCEQVDGRFDEVFLLSSGSEALEVLVALRETAAINPRRSVLVLLDHIPDPDWLEGLPSVASVQPIYLPAACGNLTLDDRDLLCFKLIQATSAGARLHIAPCAFGRRFLTRFAPVLEDNRVILYRPADPVRSDHGGYATVDPVYFHTISENLSAIAEVTCSDERTLRLDRNRLRFETAKWNLKGASII